MINSKDLFYYTQHLSILFIEDHAELRSNVTQILSNFFSKVDAAKDGEEALELYIQEYKKDKPYDIVITDIQMPKLNGVALTQEIYKIVPTQTLIVLSAHDESQYLLPLINLGIEQFIKKPIDFQELLRVLFQICKKNNCFHNTSTQNISTIELDTNMQYDRDKAILLKNKEVIYLTKYEIIFLEILTKELGRVSSNTEIVEKYEELNEKIDAPNIRKLVSKLRKKLPQNTLESIYGVGYRLLPRKS